MLTFCTHRAGDNHSDVCPQPGLQIVCRNCSRNKYPLKYLKDRMAKVCDGCYGELKKRGGDVPGLMRGNLSSWWPTGLLPAPWLVPETIFPERLRTKAAFKEEPGVPFTYEAPFPKMLVPWKIDRYSQMEGSVGSPVWETLGLCRW